MNAGKIGRNAPCPCGSGKKYKHCCLRQDRQRRQPPSVQGQLDQTLRLGRQVLRHAPPDRAQELQHLVSMAEEMTAFTEMHDEIDAAMQTLETHRDEFETLMADLAAVMTRAEQLFSEEQFQSMRYTADDVQRTFEAVGYPSRYQDEPSDEDMEILVAAAVHLAGDELQRLRLSRRLTMLLPEYVAAGRYLDAWLIQYSAYRLVETPDESNPFMFVMFNLGFEEWANQITDQQVTFFRQLGLDKLKSGQMRFKEAIAWVEEQLADPEKEAELEAFYQAHPMLHEQAQAEAMKLHDDAFLLLERDDADCLYLSLDELEPWLLIFRERIAPLETLTQRATERGNSPDLDTIQAMRDKLVELTREMAAAIFVPGRLAQLIADLKGYRYRLMEAGEKKASLYAHLTLSRLEKEPLAEERFLMTLCFASLRATLKALAEQGQAVIEAETEIQKQ